MSKRPNKTYKRPSMKGNTNAVKHGIYRAIWMDALTDEEKEFIKDVQTDVLAQIETELLLTEVRERRIMMRMKELMGYSFTVTGVTKEDGIGVQGKIDKKTVTKEGTLGQIQRIEEVLTKVQLQKSKLIELKHKVLNTDLDSEEDDNLATLSKVLKESMKVLKVDKYGDD